MGVEMQMPISGAGAGAGAGGGQAGVAVAAGVTVGTTVRRKFAGYGWYDGVVRHARSAGASLECEVEWEDGNSTWIKQAGAQKYAAQ
jgi:hypothetical protein